MSSTTVALPSSHSRPLPHTPQAFLPPGANTHGVTTSNMTKIQNFSYLAARKQESLFSCLTTTLHVLCARRESLASCMLQLKRSNRFNESIKFGDNCWRAGAIAPAVEKAQVQRVACTSALHRLQSRSRCCLNFSPTCVVMFTQSMRLAQQREVTKSTQLDVDIYYVPSSTGSPRAAPNTQPPPPPPPTHLSPPPRPAPPRHPLAPRAPQLVSPPPK